MNFLNILFLFNIVIITTVVHCSAKRKPPTTTITISRDAARVKNKHSTKTFSKANATTCQIFIKTDLPKPSEPQPLYINPKTNELWEPNAKGVIEIPRGQSIELYCANTFSTVANTENFIPKSTTIKPTCENGKFFKWQAQNYRLSQFTCKSQLSYAVEKLNEKCAGETAEIFRVGFNITENRFIETMRICYDMEIMRNHYTEHRMSAANAYFQSNVPRLKFSKAGFFGKHNVDFYYKQRNQWQRALEIFGNNKTVAQIFNDQEVFLARGHLAAKADYIYANQQRATFTFLNVAPQWQSFNGGQWSSLEDNVRKFLSKSQLDVICYTGTWGTLSLRPPNRFNLEAQLFHLAKDENNNDILPVPKIFYRVIVERKKPYRGIALVGVNNPLATLNEIQESYIICEDIQDKVKWLSWIRGNQNLKKGYIYACNVKDFIKTVNILPKHLRNVNETLI